MGERRNTGSLEILTGDASNKYGPIGPGTFSPVLCSVLEDMADESFTMSRLYKRLVLERASLPRMPSYEFPEHSPRIRLQAVKARSSITEDLEKIRTILLNVNIIPQQGNLNSRAWMQWIWSYAPRQIAGMKVTPNKALGKYCFTIRVKVAATPMLDYTLWTRWIDHAPANLQWITVDVEQASQSSDQDSVASFVAQLNFKLKINENLGQRYYQSVTVLPVMWKKPTINYLTPEEEVRTVDELDSIRDELEGISEVFEDDFHYHVKRIFELSADDSTIARYDLIDEIHHLTRMHGRSTSSLLIIVYGGHGEDTRYSTSEEGDCVWVA